MRKITNENSVIVSCGHCQIEFRVLRLRYNERKKKNNDWQFYCCKECRMKETPRKCSKTKLDLSRNNGTRREVSCFTCEKVFELPANKIKEKNFCENACCISYMAQRNRELPSPDTFSKWLKFVEVGNDDTCWEWKGLIRSKESPYGLFTWPRKRVMGAHVASYILFTGDEDVIGYMICHTCDNPKCVNPFHLFKGTSADNQIDSILKHRAKVGAKSKPAKFSETQVLDIRNRLGAGEKVSDLAQEFGVHVVTIYNMKYRKTYYHLYED